MVQYGTIPKKSRITSCMHSSPSQSLTNSNLFEIQPNYPTNHSSTTTTLWSNSTVAVPSPPCPLVLGIRRRRIHENIGHCLRKPCSSPPHSIPLILLEEDTTLDPLEPLHRPTQPTKASPCTPTCQTDIQHHPSIYMATTCPSPSLDSHFTPTPPPNPPKAPRTAP
jgi:hypothetical protein